MDFAPQRLKFSLYKESPQVPFPLNCHETVYAKKITLLRKNDCWKYYDEKINISEYIISYNWELLDKYIGKEDNLYEVYVVITETETA